MATIQTKEELLMAVTNGYQELTTLIDSTDKNVLEADFAPVKANAKCTTFEQGNNLRDILMHIYEWQRLQILFVENIRRGEPKDFIPDPYRKNYKEMDRVNWERHQSVTLAEALTLLADTHAEVVRLIGTFSNEELFNKKVFKVTYTTTMGAYFVCVTSQPYGKAVKSLKAHLRNTKK